MGAYLQVVHWLYRFHSTDPLFKCFVDRAYVAKDLQLRLQLLDLIATPLFQPAVHYLMAAFATRRVTDPFHLLAMDPTKDTRGDTVTTAEFNADASWVRELYHKTHVPIQVFLPFVMARKLKTKYVTKDEQAKLRSYHAAFKFDKIQRLAMLKIRRYQLYRRFHKYFQSDYSDVFHIDGILTPAKAVQDDETSAMVQILSKLQNHKLKSHWPTIVRAVAICQKPLVLKKLIDCIKPLDKNCNMQDKAVKEYLLGAFFDPCDASNMLRAIQQWG